MAGGRWFVALMRVGDVSPTCALPPIPSQRVSPLRLPCVIRASLPSRLLCNKFAGAPLIYPTLSPESTWTHRRSVSLSLCQTRAPIQSSSVPSLSWLRTRCALSRSWILGIEERRGAFSSWRYIFIKREKEKMEKEVKRQYRSAALHIISSLCSVASIAFCVHLSISAADVRSRVVGLESGAAERTFIQVRGYSMEDFNSLVQQRVDELLSQVNLTLHFFFFLLPVWFRLTFACR